jgi:hypothetical protein
MLEIWTGQKICPKKHNAQNIEGQKEKNCSQNIMLEILMGKEKFVAKT